MARIKNKVDVFCPFIVVFLLKKRFQLEVIFPNRFQFYNRISHVALIEVKFGIILCIQVYKSNRITNTIYLSKRASLVERI